MICEEGQSFTTCTPNCPTDWMCSVLPSRTDELTASIGVCSSLKQRWMGNSRSSSRLFCSTSLAAPKGTSVPDDGSLPDRATVEHTLVDTALKPFLDEVAAQRAKEVDTISRHMEISLGELINRQNLQLAELVGRQQSDVTVPGLDGNISLAESHLDELNNRLENRRAELRNEKQCTIGDIQHLGRAWVLPHPERNAPGIAFMVRDEEIERIAIEEAKKYETSRGWEVESVEADNRGFDLISRKPHPA